MTSDFRRDHAVVLGASMAGLATARVLSERFERVTIVDRNDPPEGVASIAPQGRYPHVLLAAGARALERLFPGIGRELTDAGAQVATNENGRWWADGWRLNTPIDVAAPMATRALLESTTRARVRALPNVEIRYGTAIEALEIDRGVVRGVRARGGRALAGDLVLDCSGRNSQLAKWLKQAGFAVPPPTEVPIDLTYAAATLPRASDDLDGYLWGVVQNLAPRTSRLGLALSVEGNRWMIVLGAYFGEKPPTDRAGYLAFARSLPVDIIARLLERAAPLADPILYRYRSSRRVHFERVRMPAGLLVLGDALCSFNPIYGQGMSVALLQAERLGRCLDEHRSAATLSRTAVREMARIADRAWQIAAGADLAYPRVAAPRPSGTRLVNRYMGKVFRACTVDPHVVTVMSKVTNLLEPPRQLFRPELMWRVWRAQSRSRSRQSHAAA